MARRNTAMHDAVHVALQGASGPMTAYEILDRLRPGHAKLAPPTIYRALAALVAEGRAHRIESSNAFLANRGEAHDAAPVLTICDECGRVEEQVSMEGGARPVGARAQRWVRRHPPRDRDARVLRRLHGGRRGMRGNRLLAGAAARLAQAGAASAALWLGFLWVTA